jgi:segregation and condensation protein B
VGQLAQALETSSHRVQEGLEDLAERYQRHGIRLQKQGNSYQLTSAPELAQDIQRFLNLESTTRLTRAALEVMAIVAYQQLVTRPQIDAIRGVNSDSVLRTLLRHGLIEEAGRAEGPGRPILYATTAEFLQHFGLSKLEDLPPLDTERLTEMRGPESLGDGRAGSESSTNES